MFFIKLIISFIVSQDFPCKEVFPVLQRESLIFSDKNFFFTLTFKFFTSALCALFAMHFPPRNFRSFALAITRLCFSLALIQVKGKCRVKGQDIRDAWGLIVRAPDVLSARGIVRKFMFLAIFIQTSRQQTSDF